MSPSGITGLYQPESGCNTRAGSPRERVHGRSQREKLTGGVNGRLQREASTGGVNGRRQRERVQERRERVQGRVSGGESRGESPGKRVQGRVAGGEPRGESSGKSVQGGVQGRESRGESPGESARRSPGEKFTPERSPLDIHFGSLPLDSFLWSPPLDPLPPGSPALTLPPLNSLSRGGSPWKSSWRGEYRRVRVSPSWTPPLDSSPQLFLWNFPLNSPSGLHPTWTLSPGPPRTVPLQNSLSRGERRGKKDRGRKSRGESP
uniref:Uncharacterized protein n=1 Tax=Knipowitschia caucasica TaxID=637954 RepID=A0AAV2J591_KNICA